jgi:hypothetical protein
VNSNNFKNFNFTDIISTIHLSDLNDIIQSNLINKDTINDNINNLKYRNLIIVNFVFKKEDVQNFQEHWIDIHDSSIKALRVTNFGNYNFENEIEIIITLKKIILIMQIQKIDTNKDIERNFKIIRHILFYKHTNFSKMVWCCNSSTIHFKCLYS